MQISNIQENTFKRDLFLGVENFYPTAVNPNMKELNAMGMKVTSEPVYHGKVKRDFGGVEKEYDFFSVRIFLDNKDVINPIKTQVQYTIIKDYHQASTGSFKVLNKYGSNSWLQDTNITSGTLPSNMQWYVNEEVKKAYRGEDSLIDFIKALRNLPNITQTSTKADKTKGEAMLQESDLDKMFKGNFSDIRNVILDPTGTSKVGFLLGVRIVEDTPRQSLYSRMPLKAYIRATDNTKYLVKDVQSAQDNGAMSDTYFDLVDTKLKVYDEDMKVEPEEILMEQGDDDDLPF